MWWCHGSLPLCLLACLVSVLGPHVTQASSDVPPWTIKECPLPSRPADHPVSVYRPAWINLKKQAGLSRVSWLTFSGVIHNMQVWGLKSGVVYRVTSHNDTTFAFQEEDNGPLVAYRVEGNFMVLDEGSYGFVSCSENREKATQAAWAWWGEIPFSYITVVLICVGVAMLVVIIVATAVGVAWRRRSRGNAHFI